MDLLLDTHVFLWWDADRPELGGAARRLIAEPRNRIFVSAASVWEIAIKRRTGKLRFDGAAVDAIGRNGFLELPVRGQDAEAAGGLDWTHSDPFDRLLVAQGRIHGMTLVTADAAMLAFEYGVRLAAGSS